MTTTPHPAGDQPHAHLLDSRRTYIVGLVDVSGAYIDEEQHAVTGIPAGPALVLHTHGAIKGHQITLDVILPQVTEELAAGLVDSVRKALDPEHQAAASAVAREANLRAGLIPGGPAVHCPGCNSRLYGEVALRGGCLACYPDVGPLEHAADLGQPEAQA